MFAQAQMKTTEVLSFVFECIRNTTINNNNINNVLYIYIYSLHLSVGSSTIM